jgi:hypothetical protein
MPSLNAVGADKRSWTYASLTVLDGQRRLRPCEVSFDRLIFHDPPRLTSSHVEIILANGDDKQLHTAAVLPHEAEATEIPIQLLPHRV